MSYEQQADIYAAADYLQLSVAAVRRRVKAGTFPLPDIVEDGAPWWSIETLDKYQRALARKKRTKRS